MDLENVWSPAQCQKGAGDGHPPLANSCRTGVGLAHQGGSGAGAGLLPPVCCHVPGPGLKVVLKKILPSEGLLPHKGEFLKARAAHV